MTYPVMLNLRGKRIMIVGGGAVAARKLAGVLNQEATITVISPTLNPQLVDWCEAGALVWMRQAYVTYLLEEIGPLLVFAATDSPEVNAQVVRDAEQLGVLVNRVDDSDECTFSNMTTIDRSPLTVALSSSGAAPLLTKRLAEKLDAAIGDGMQTLAQWLGDLRPIVKQHVAQDERAAFWDALISETLLEAAESGNLVVVRRLIADYVRERLGDDVWQPR